MLLSDLAPYSSSLSLRAALAQSAQPLTHLWLHPDFMASEEVLCWTRDREWAVIGAGTTWCGLSSDCSPNLVLAIVSLPRSVNDAINVLPGATCAYLNGGPLLTCAAFPGRR
jgi:hypothetical protein